MGDERPQFSVIVPAYNRRDELLTCLASLRACALERGGIEVVVVDDGSTDGTTSAVRDRFPAVRLVDLRENRGPSYARNIGILEARGDLLLFLDSDARPGSPHVFESALRWFSEHKETGTVGGEVRCYEAGQNVAYGRLICRNGDSRSVSVPLEPGRYVACDFLPTCGCFVRGEVARRVGGFDPGYGFGGEDKDFGYRIGKAGYTNYLSADCAVRHYHSPRGRRTDETYRYHKTRMRFVLKHASPGATGVAIASWLGLVLLFHVTLPAKLALLVARRRPLVRENVLGGWYAVKALTECVVEWGQIAASRRTDFLRSLELKERRPRAVTESATWC